MSTVNPLTDAEIIALAPAVASRDHAANVGKSGHYQLFNTMDLITGLRNEGFVPTLVSCNKVNHSDTYHTNRINKAGEEQFRKHMIRFTHQDYLDKEDNRPELILINSHNGSCSYQLMSGIFRFVCQNGLIVRGKEFEDARIRHMGHTMDEVIAASVAISSKFREIYPVISELQNIKLTALQCRQFAREAALVKYGKHLKEDDEVINTSDLLTVRRPEDEVPTLWNVFNTTQENLIKGGRKIAKRIMRPVQRIEEDVRINTGLWDIAMKFRDENRLAVA